ASTTRTSPASSASSSATRWAERPRSERLAVLLRVTARAGDPAGQEPHVDVQVLALVGVVAIADHEEARGPVAAVLQVVAVAHPGLEARAVAGAHGLFAGVGDQHQFTFQHVDELVLAGMPVALAGPDAGVEGDQVDAERGQARGIAQLQPAAAAARQVVRRRIARALSLRRGFEVDLAHRVSSTSATSPAAARRPRNTRSFSPPPWSGIRSTAACRTWPASRVTCSRR